MPRDTIKSLAKEIQQRWPHLNVSVERGFCNTDRKPKGCRYITHVGRGRYGSQIIVKDTTGVVLLNHNNAETYRRTSEVRDWIEHYSDLVTMGELCANCGHSYTAHNATLKHQCCHALCNCTGFVDNGFCGEPSVLSNTAKCTKVKGHSGNHRMRSL